MTMENRRREETEVGCLMRVLGYLTVSIFGFGFLTGVVVMSMFS